MRCAVLNEAMDEQWTLLIENLERSDFDTFNRPEFPSDEIQGVGTTGIPADHQPAHAARLPTKGRMSTANGSPQASLSYATRLWPGLPTEGIGTFLVPSLPAFVRN